MAESNSLVQHWNEQWQHEAGRSEFLHPEPDVIDTVPLLQERGLTRALDLGCGIGRHSLYLAQQGLDTTATDLSTSGLEFTQVWSREQELDIQFQQCPMHSLPFADASFDYCLSWNVIYHGDLGDLAAAVREVSRLLRPGGLFQATLLSKRNSNFCVGEEIATDTWINTEDAEKAHPHCYRNAEEVCHLLSEAGLEVLSLRDTQHQKPGSYHWHLLAEKQINEV
jgi:2-polyprenyl-3-methyl-5-hydroxy-6-metoxy-1,4-benzoquinol methylase